MIISKTKLNWSINCTTIIWEKIIKIIKNNNNKKNKKKIKKNNKDLTKLKDLEKSNIKIDDLIF